LSYEQLTNRFTAHSVVTVEAVSGPMTLTARAWDDTGVT
jgi:hypothetical protein